ncbi:MAG: outer membrane beta-barrel protein [Legionellaceae bacterium]|nr:outer membrane beta-barrel protein [Legionellaceae bacterium]
MSFSKIVKSFFLVCLCSITHAQNTQQAISPWYLDTGIRYWLGKSDFEFNLYDYSGTEHFSRLTDQNVTTNTAEGFWRLGHQDGVFLKGYVGAGSNIGGEFIDEDFPPALDVYSRTKSDQNHGRLNYLSFDLGYDLIQHDRYKVSPFIGYHYWLTHYNAFGCNQTADNPDVCTTLAFSSLTDTLNDTATWNALRLGLNGDVKLANNVNFSVDAAYIHAYLIGHDYHNLRSDIRGAFFDGVGDGAQVDLALNWLATPDLSMGIGARWWNVNTGGYAHFEELAVEGRPQAVNASQQNYGLIVQSQYRFDDSKQHIKSTDKDDINKSPAHWRGLFMGANVGYGMNPNNTSILPYQSTPDDFAFVSPRLIHLQSSGFLGGAQIGYNWTKNNVLWGLESDIDYAAIGGTNSITFIFDPYLINNSVTQQFNALATVRGRLGKVVSNVLLPYITAGVSFANAGLTYAQSIAYGNHPFLDNTYDYSILMTNWVAGAGLEYAVSNHMSYKLEYLYLDLGNQSLETNYYAVDSAFASNVLRLGINYHF